jgi:hypothetical protein
MAIHMSEEEAKVLNQFAYMNIAGIEGFVKKELSLRALATALLEKRDASINENKIIPSFGEWGGFTNKEQYEMLQDIKDGKYSNISDLRLKDFAHNPKTDFYAYAFYEEEDRRNVALVMRGTMGTQIGENSFFKQLDGFTGKSWIDNADLGFSGVSLQFHDAQDFYKRNRDPGEQTFCTGFSKGAANCAFLSANNPGVTGIGFNGPGIGHALIEEQWERLKNSGYYEITCDTDIVGPLYWHPEREKYAKCKPVVDRDKNGDPIYVNGQPKYKEGFGAVHYLQAFDFDKAGSAIGADKPEQAKKIEIMSRETYVLNKLNGNPLGLSVHGIDILKNVAPAVIQAYGAAEYIAMKNSEIGANGATERDMALLQQPTENIQDTIGRRGEVIKDSIALDVKQKGEALKKIGEAVLKSGEVTLATNEMDVAAHKDMGDGLINAAKKTGKAVVEGNRLVGEGNEAEAKAWQSIGDAFYKKAEEGLDWFKKKIFGPSGDHTSWQPADNKGHAQTEQGSDKLAGLNPNSNVENKGATEARFREFSAMAPNASLEQRKQAALTSVALNSIFDNTYRNPEIREFMNRGVKDMLTEALQSGDRILPIQKYDPEAEPTRVVRTFTQEELQKDQSQEKGIERQYC